MRHPQAISITALLLALLPVPAFAQDQEGSSDAEAAPAEEEAQATDEESVEPESSDSTTDEAEVAESEADSTPEEGESTSADDSDENSAVEAADADPTAEGTGDTPRDVAEESSNDAPEPQEDSSAPVTDAEPEPTGTSVPTDTDLGASSAPISPVKSTDDSKSEGKGKPEVRWREKPLRTTVGIPPTQRDLGNEADIFIDDEEKLERKAKEWKIDLKAFIRGTARFSLGPKHDGSSGTEFHAPARIPGLSSGDWDHIGVIPNPSAKAYLSAGTPTLSAHIILGGQPPIDEGFANPKEAGWFLDSYVAMKFPRAFGAKGGIALTAGSFGHRYGNAGKKSTGFYRTYLFGKTHAVGAVYTLDYDITPHWEVIFEHGAGAKSEAIPWLDPDDPKRPDADYIPGQGDVPRGSNYIHHAHLQFRHDYWLRAGAHYLTSWSPNDNALSVAGKVEEARLTVTGAEVNVDLPTGHGYLGYAHMEADDILPLSNGVQTLHASQGTDFKKIYFGFRDRLTGQTPTNDSGQVDTVLFQYIWKVSNSLHLGPDLDLGVFGMFTHVNSPIEDPNLTSQEHLQYGRLKFGAEVQYEFFPFMRAAFRYDNVNSDMSTSGRNFQTVSPRLFFFSKKGSKEYVVLNYSYFFYGDDVFPGSPYRDFPVSPDPHFFGLSAVMSL